MNNTIPYAETLFGFQNWQSGDKELDEKRIESLIGHLKTICFDMNAAQMKAFLSAVIVEIDRRAKI